MHRLDVPQSEYQGSEPDADALHERQIASSAISSCHQ
jgi:hypothetical protein